LASEGKLNKTFKTGAGDISYHIPCHLRAQNVGYKTRDVLSLLPDTQVKVVEECSGHDGTWAMKKEHFQQSLKWGSRAFEQMAEGDPKVTCSDCPLAAIQIEQANGKRPLNPMQILAKSYRGETIGEAVNRLALNPAKPQSNQKKVLTTKDTKSTKFGV
jgi:Fe-S oxidoreductase